MCLFIPLFWFTMIVSSLIPCCLTSFLKSSSAADLASRVRPEEDRVTITQTDPYTEWKTTHSYKENNKFTHWWIQKLSLTIKLDYGGSISWWFLCAQQEHHCILVIVGMNHEGIDICSEPCRIESVHSTLHDRFFKHILVDGERNILATWWKNRPGVLVKP